MTKHCTCRPPVGSPRTQFRARLSRLTTSFGLTWKQIKENRTRAWSSFLMATAARKEAGEPGRVGHHAFCSDGWPPTVSRELVRGLWGPSQPDGRK